MPSDFMKDNLKRDEVVAWQRGKMMALRWKDKKDVCILSTVHNVASSVVKSQGEKEVQKPAAVLDYNHTMGGVDKADQELTFYPVMRKQQKRYYKKFSGICWNSVCGMHTCCLCNTVIASGLWNTRIFCG